MLRLIMDYLTRGRLQWNRMPPVFERFLYPGGQLSRSRQSLPPTGETFWPLSPGRKRRCGNTFAQLPPPRGGTPGITWRASLLPPSRLSFGNQPARRRRGPRQRPGPLRAYGDARWRRAGKPRGDMAASRAKRVRHPCADREPLPARRVLPARVLPHWTRPSSRSSRPPGRGVPELDDQEVLVEGGRAVGVASLIEAARIPASFRYWRPSSSPMRGPGTRSSAFSRLARRQGPAGSWRPSRQEKAP